MTPLNYFLPLIISFLGLYSGFTLAHFTKEELKDIHHYMVLIKFALILMIATSFMLFIKVYIWFVILLVIMVGLTVYFIEVPTFLVYFLLGGVFYISSANDVMLFITSFFIFALGLPIGTLMAEKNMKVKKDIIFKIFYEHIFYVVVAAFLFFLLS